uniref:protein CROWDED NUCLEI 1-like n=1 Tax=Erigeron canadensis TaxID=72917 RepID=UPI001CB92612|nr:protein CROWDED NUCLEI 1-like [Erigeron canadensis]
MSKDKNENNNPVVAIPLSSYQCPILNNSNYTLWALRMKKILVANGIWDIVEGTGTSKEIDIKKDSSASAYLFQGLPEDLQMQVAGCETAKEIWDSLKARFVGTEDVQQAHSQQLKSEFERLVMKKDESIDSFAGKLMSIITKAATCGLTFDEQTKVRKLLNVVPYKFIPIVATIEMVVDFKEAKLEEVIGKLKTYEERLKFRKESGEDNSEKSLFTRQGNGRNYERNYGNNRRGGGNQTKGRGQGRFMRDNRNEDSFDRWKKSPGDQNNPRRQLKNVQCYNCQDFGHFATNCPKPNHREEKTNLVFKNDEPELLMVTTKDEEDTTSLKEKKRRNGILIKEDEIPKGKLDEMRSEIESELRSKLEFWKFELLQDFEMGKQEFEKKMKSREIAFEKQMQKELENLKKLKDCTSKEMKELESEREKFEKENHGVVSRKKHLEEEPRVDNDECKKHQETPSRFQKESKIGKDIKSRNKKVESEDHNTRNTLLEIQDYEMIQMMEVTDKVNNDDQDEIEDKNKINQIEEEVQGIVRVKDQVIGNGNKPKFKDNDYEV